MIPLSWGDDTTRLNGEEKNRKQRFVRNDGWHILFYIQFKGLTAAVKEQNLKFKRRGGICWILSKLNFISDLLLFTRDTKTERKRPEHCTAQAYARALHAAVSGNCYCALSLAPSKLSFRTENGTSSQNNTVSKLIEIFQPCDRDMLAQDRYDKNTDLVTEK